MELQQKEDVEEEWAFECIEELTGWITPEDERDAEVAQMMEEAEVSPLAPGRAAPFGSGQEAKRLFVLCVCG